MKLDDRYIVAELAARREKLLQALEFTAPGYTGSGFGVTIQGTYQPEETLALLRPAAHAIFTQQLDELDAKLAKLGVEP